LPREKAGGRGLVVRRWGEFPTLLFLCRSLVALFFDGREKEALPRPQ